MAPNVDKCELCKRIYKRAKEIINNNTVADVTQIGTGFLCSIVAIVTQEIPDDTANPAKTICKQIARRVINYIRKNGFSKPPQDACISIGLCP